MVTYPTGALAVATGSTRLNIVAWMTAAALEDPASRPAPDEGPPELEHHDA